MNYISNTWTTFWIGHWNHIIKVSYASNLFSLTSVANNHRIYGKKYIWGLREIFIYLYLIICLNCWIVWTCQSLVIKALGNDWMLFEVYVYKHFFIITRAFLKLQILQTLLRENRSIKSSAFDPYAVQQCKNLMRGLHYVVIVCFSIPFFFSALQSVHT